MQESPAVKAESAHEQYDAPAATAISSYDGGQASGYGDYGHENGSAMHDPYGGQDSHDNDDSYGPIGIKEDG